MKYFHEWVIYGDKDIISSTRKKGRRIVRGKQKRVAHGSSRWPSMR